MQKLEFRSKIPIPSGVLGKVILLPLVLIAIAVSSIGHVWAQAQPSRIETALLSPDVDLRSLRQDAALPVVLTKRDRALYREIFAAQEGGDWKTADQKIAQLEDPVLMGHVLEQRYMHPTAYRSKYHELRNWLARYADHPGANRIYSLAMRRKPDNASAPKVPIGGELLGYGHYVDNPAPAYVSPRKRSAASKAEYRKIRRTVRSLVQRGRPSQALKYLDRDVAHRTLDAVELAMLKGYIGKGYFNAGKDKRALELANKAAQIAGYFDPEIHWTAGLAAWRLKNYDAAARNFESLALSETSGPWMVSAAAYWASRVRLVQRRPGEATRWLGTAAIHPFTFYGLLARRALGMELPLDWSQPGLSEAEEERLLATPPMRRALALTEVSETIRAEKELRKIYRSLDREMERIVLTVAIKSQLPGLSYRLATRKQALARENFPAGLYPVPNWKPKGGFTLDRAIVYGLIRQESGFDAGARSGQGARGLMQILPRTARYVAKKADLETETTKRALYDPETNLALGQEYVTYLLQHPTVNNNLFYAFASYNAGPGNVRKWQREIKHLDDPLLFIESLPSRETRYFVERVMSNFWIYRKRLGQATPSLDAVASGRWPMFVSLDETLAAAR